MSTPAPIPEPPKPAKPPRTGPTFRERLRLLWKDFQRFAKRALPAKGDDENARLFKKIAWALIGMAALVVFLASAVFFLSLKGQEETMVPRVVGEELVTAILELQEKELVPVVQVKFSTDPRQKGSVIAQDPEGGLQSKAGRRVTLWVSKGAVVDTVEDYVGQNVNDVELHLKTVFATQAQPLITIGPDPTYLENPAAEGTILEQQPLPGTQLGSPVQLKLVISRGPKGQTVKVGNYVGLAWADAVNVLANDSIPFAITSRKADPGEKAGVFVSQNPSGGSELAKGAPVALTLTEPPALADGRAFHLLSTKLPEYPILVDLKVVLKRVTGENLELLQMKHPGGAFTLPYWASPGDSVAVSVLDKEVYSEKVPAKTE